MPLNAIQISDRPTLDLIEAEQTAEGSATAAATARRLIVEAATARRSARPASRAPLPQAASAIADAPDGQPETPTPQEAA
jgi:hypothetical protein